MAELPRTPTDASRQPTMADIAHHLGISRQLVSIVLRDQPGASPETRRRVREAAEHLGYRPHIGARVLRQSTSRQIGVVFAPAHATEPDIVEAIYPLALEQGYQLVLSASTATRSSEHAIEELLGYRCAALVVIGSDLPPARLSTLAQRARVPVVAVSYSRASTAYDVVRSAGDDGIALAVRHLAALGHRRIAYTHLTAMGPARIRYLGYRRAMRSLDLEQSVVKLAGDFTEEGGARAARVLLEAEELPTAVVASNDQAALGVILTLARAGVSVPDDVSVTGYDDSHFARLSAVDLTTLTQDPREMGRACVEAVLARVVQPDAATQELVITPELVVRSSTAAPRS